MQTAIRRTLLLAPVVAAMLTGIAFQRYERREVPRNSTPIVIVYVPKNVPPVSSDFSVRIPSAITSSICSGVQII